MTTPVDFHYLPHYCLTASCGGRLTFLFVLWIYGFSSLSLWRYRRYSPAFFFFLPLLSIQGTWWPRDKSPSFSSSHSWPWSPWWRTSVTKASAPTATASSCCGASAAQRCWWPCGWPTCGTTRCCATSTPDSCMCPSPGPTTRCTSRGVTPKRPRAPSVFLHECLFSSARTFPASEQLLSQPKQLLLFLTLLILHLHHQLIRLILLIAVGQTPLPCLTWVFC